MQTILFIITAIIAVLIIIAIIIINFVRDITLTSDKALEEHYKRNKK